MSFEAAVAPTLLRARPDLKAVALVGALVVATVVLRLSWPLPPDTSWLLTVCERMLAGQSLYSDIAELNPPMSAWLYLPFVWLAPKLGLTPDVLVPLATIATCLLMTAASERILLRAGLLPSREAWWIVVTIALLILPVFTFSQREHFAVAFALPMLAALAARCVGKPAPLAELVFAGVFAGLTMAIKPHFAAAIALPGLYCVFARRSLAPIVAPECVVAGLTFGLYCAGFAALHPQYFTDMMPIATEIYLPNRISWQLLLTLPYVVLTGLCVVSWLFRDGLDPHPLPRVLLAATAGFFIAYVVQGRGWTYHLLPAFTLANIGFCLSTLGAVSRVGVHELPRRVMTSVLTVLTFLSIVFVSAVSAMERGRDEVRYLDTITEVLAPLGGHLKIAVVSEDIAVANPLHRMIGATLVNRGPVTWIAGNAMRLCEKDRSEERRPVCDRAIAKEREMLLEDLKRTPPDVVLAAHIDRDWLAWARQDPETAKILDDFGFYAFVDVSEMRIEVLVRKDLAPPGLRPSLPPQAAR